MDIQDSKDKADTLQAQAQGSDTDAHGEEELDYGDQM